MSNMERFTQRARRVLSIAHQEAERMRHSYIGTEHLLIGLMLEEGGLAARVLKELGLGSIKPTYQSFHQVCRRYLSTPLIRLESWAIII